ncbi:c-type cytochrome [Cyclobacterium sp. 1_MG-2023]|uniref:c-type cytochrome n=1 Tax=Cyclobacterium sp. 1_MG-2023 TaxID=3062681 RepID=UPI0026E2122E|nr:c-type cytochrome [Cyclobacterium sp. 1_MG-2023]MDO6436331.1 c-type cytochrome [Cyclobacterium sp. 1_MG-2023]
MKDYSKIFIVLARGLLSLSLLLVTLSIFLGALLFLGFYSTPSSFQVGTQVPQGGIIKDSTKEMVTEDNWTAPDKTAMEKAPNAAQLSYGQELISHTSEYLGPEGKVLHISNGMNCQNCHLEAGTIPFGNNFSGVAANYPKIRARSGLSEGIPKRINDCFQRSLNGEALDPSSEEMKAMVAYIKWLGKDVPKGHKPKGSGIYQLGLLNRAADPIQGKTIYEKKCNTCHGTEGQGLKAISSTSYIYPPLWGPSSYNDGAGLYRLSRFAGYVKANMPLGASFKRPLLSDEEAWDLAAYVNSMPRPNKDLSGDWPDISKKPMDHPFGPYADEFSEKQHKYGPYQEIIAARK